MMERDMVRRGDSSITPAQAVCCILRDMHVDVLREMVRLAEKRRDEALHMIERMNKYNLAIVAFAGSFLSVLVTADMPIEAVRLSGACLIASVIVSIAAVRPERIQGGALDVAEDVVAFRQGQTPSLECYLADVAELTNGAAESLQHYANRKKKWTIVAALFLALSLVSAYILAAYA